MTTRPSYQQMRIEQMAFALGVPPAVLGLPEPTPLEIAEDRFFTRVQQLEQTFKKPHAKAPRREEFDSLRLRAFA